MITSPICSASILNQPFETFVNWPASASRTFNIYQTSILKSLNIRIFWPSLIARQVVVGTYSISFPPNCCLMRMFIQRKYVYTQSFAKLGFAYIHFRRKIFILLVCASKTFLIDILWSFTFDTVCRSLLLMWSSRWDVGTKTARALQRRNKRAHKKSLKALLLIFHRTFPIAAAPTSNMQGWNS